MPTNLLTNISSGYVIMTKHQFFLLVIIISIKYGLFIRMEIILGIRWRKLLSSIFFIRYHPQMSALHLSMNGSFEFVKQKYILF